MRSMINTEFLIGIFRLSRSLFWSHFVELPSLRVIGSGKFLLRFFGNKLCYFCGFVRISIISNFIFHEDIPDFIRALWPAPGSEDTELGVLLEPEVGHGEAEVYTRVQA